MEHKEIRIDVRRQSPKELALAREQARTLFTFNHTMPETEDYDKLMRSLFPTMGEGSRVSTPLSGVRFHNVRIGRGVVVMPGYQAHRAAGRLRGPERSRRGRSARAGQLRRLTV